MIPTKADFAVGTYSDGSGPVVTVHYDMTPGATSSNVWIFGGDVHSDRWVAFDWQHADEIADTIKEVAAALRTQAATQKEAE